MKLTITAFDKSNYLSFSNPNDANKQLQEQ